MPSQSPAFECQVLSWWPCLGEALEVQLHGRSASPEVDSEVSEAHAILSSLPLLSACDLRCELSALDFLLHLLCLPPSMLCPLVLIYSALRSRKPKAHPSFYKVPRLLFNHSNRNVSNTVILYFVFIKVIIDAQICVSVPIKSYQSIKLTVF